MFSTGKGDYVAEKAESNSGWLFPVGNEVHELGYSNIFTDMFEAIEQRRDPLATFYDGYVINAVIDAAYASAKSCKWEPIQLEDWRRHENTDTSIVFHKYDEQHYLIKEEILPDEGKVLILKNKKSWKISRRTFC